MPEGNVNTEVAEHLREHAHGEHDGHGGDADARPWWRRELVEVLEAVLLSLVAIATAWSGYQAAKWDSESARGYATSSRERVQSEQLYLASNQTIIYNAGNLSSWLQAESAGNTQLAAVFERRFTPEYKVAFDAWVKTKPLANPDAPPGPRQMPEYKDPLAAQSTALSNQATVAFDNGVTAREHADKYVRITVILAAVLFLIAIGQRFKLRNVRITVACVAGVFLVYAAVTIAMLPRI